MTQAIRIPLSKGKIWLLAILCVLFIVVGFFFVLTPHHFKSPLIHNLFIIRVLGFMALVLFGYFLGSYLPFLMDQRPGLIIDAEGLLDHSTAVSPGRVPWGDVTGIYRKSIATQKFMVVKVRNPEDYIERATGDNKRLLKGNLQLCGSPIAISANMLNCSFKRLERLLNEAFTRYKGGIPPLSDEADAG